MEEPVIWPKNSTHYKNWLIKSHDQLRSIQSQIYSQGLRDIKGSLDNEEIPTFEEELWLIRYYSYQLSRFLNSNHLKAAVKETSLTFFNRFYLRKSLLEYDPRLIMFTCVTLAVKLEDMWKTVYVEKLLGGVENLNISKVFELESTVCDALSFNVLVLHTMDSFHIIREHCIQYVRDSLKLDDKTIGESINFIIAACKNAEANTTFMYEKPEFIFLYTPTQLALAAFVYHCKTSLRALISIDTFITEKFLGDNGTLLLPLMNLLNKINNDYDDFIKARGSFINDVDKAGAILDKYISIWKRNDNKEI